MDYTIIIVDYKYGHGANSCRCKVVPLGSKPSSNGLVERFPGTFGSGAHCLQARKYRVHMADGRGPCMVQTECEECRNSAKDLPRGFASPVQVKDFAECIASATVMEQNKFHHNALKEV